MKKQILVMGGGLIGKALVRALVESELNAKLLNNRVKDFNVDLKGYQTPPKNEWRGGSRGKGGKTKWPRR